MIICIVCPRLCHGGAERVAVSLANGFVTRGHEVIFFADLYEEQTFALDDSIQVQNLVPQTKNKFKKWMGAVRLLRKQLKKDNPDVIIGIMSLCSLIAKLASIGMRIPVIATEHNAFERPEEVKLSFLERFYKFYFCKFYSCLTVLAESDKKLISNKLKNVAVMPNPLPLESASSNPSKQRVVLACGRIDNWYCKGFDVLIRAFGKLVQGLKSKVQDEGWKLVIAGVWRNPETRTYLDSIAKECGVLDKIEYTGFVSDMQKLYAESSIFVLSSRYEGFGLVLIEAMSQGCACVACDYKGRQREIMKPQGHGSKLPPSLSRAPRLRDSTASVDDLRFKVQGSNNKVELCETGILCEPDDVEALAEAMKKMIEDDEYRESVRKKAIERSKYYSIENTMDRWEKLLTSVQRSRS